MLNLRVELPSSKTIDKIDSLFQARKIREAHDCFETDFLNFYEAKGYEVVPSLPLISDTDSSVIYTGASISAVKDILISGDYPDGKLGVVLSQQCLRTKAYKHAFNNEWIPFGQIYFTMVSNLSRPGRFADVLTEAVKYTNEHFGIEKDRLKIRTTSKKDKLKDVADLTDIQVEYDAKPDKYYHWDYGLPGIHGEGLTVAVYNNQNGWQDIGNIVVIYDENGKELGVEFGYGYEFFLYSALQVDQSLKLSKVFEVFEFVPGLPQKYYSTLEAVVMMKLAGAKLGDRGPDHVYKQYLKSLQFIGESLGKSMTETLNEIQVYINFTTKINSTEDDLVSESEFLHKYIKKKEDFATLTKRVGNYMWNKENNKSLKENFNDPIGTLIKFMQQRGIQEYEVFHILDRLKRFNVIERMKEHPQYREPKG